MDALLTKTKRTESQSSQCDTTGSALLLRCLIAEGVDTIFGYPGGAIMPLYDALYDYAHSLNHILVRHEQGAVHAAQGYARASGNVSVVFATSGPGATNLVTGLADALIDSTPLVCITGQVAEHLLGTDAFQEVDVINITLPVTKWNIQVTEASKIPDAIAKAFYIARSGRPGPVLVDITKNAQIEKTPLVDYKKCESIHTYHPVPTINLAQIEQAAELINNAKRPYMLIGQGVILANAMTEVKQVSEKAGIPVASTLLGLSALPVDYPLYVGYLGMHGNYAANILTNECDLIIAIGMRFDDRVTGNVSKYAKRAKVIHIELDKAEINKIIPADVAIHADAKEALQHLLPLVHENEHHEWVNRFAALHHKEYEKVIQFDYYPTSPSLKMAEVIRELGEVSQGEATIVTDVGQHQMVTSRYYPFKNPRTNITSGGLGTMGFALPAALGASVALQKQVVAIIGDGGFQMTVQELGTIMQYAIPVKIIILNNSFLGMVRQWQELFFERRYSFTAMSNPDFVALAQAYAIPAAKVTERSSLRSAIQHMLDATTPYLLEVVVDKEENVFPMVPTGAGVGEVILEQTFPRP